MRPIASKKTEPRSSRRRRRSSATKRNVSDIRVWLPYVFGLLFALELVLAFSAIRFWRIEQNAVADQKRLFLVNEILAGVQRDSITLGRLSFQASLTAESRAIAEYRNHLLEKKPAATDQSPPDIRGRNPLPVVEREIEQLRSPGARFGDAESQRLDRLSLEIESLLRIDEKALAALEGRFEDENGTFTVQKEPDPESARATLRDQSYQARRTLLNEDLAALQAAIDVRILTLISGISGNSIVFFPLALAILVLLLLATPALGWFLHNHLGKTISTHQTQIRKMNEEMSRLIGQLSALELERNELARQPTNRSSTPEPESVPVPRPPPATPRHAHSANELPPAATVFPDGFAEDYLTRLP